MNLNIRAPRQTISAKQFLLRKGRFPVGQVANLPFRPFFRQVGNLPHNLPQRKRNRIPPAFCRIIGARQDEIRAQSAGERGLHASRVAYYTHPITLFSRPKNLFSQMKRLVAWWGKV
jgi:hypothetical protein